MYLSSGPYKGELMKPELYENIFKRKSFHLFMNVGKEKLSEEELEDIKKAYEEFVPLDPSIKTKIRIVPEHDTNAHVGAEYCILMYSETKEGYLQNIGYLGQQLDLYLVSKGIGSLWYGMGKTDDPAYDGLEYVIMFCIRKIKDASAFRKDMFKSKRKELLEIWEGNEIKGVTDIARFAPSAVNSQPWLVKRDGDTLNVYRYRKAKLFSMFPVDKAAYFNRIDIGIFLCILELCLTHEGQLFERELVTGDNGYDELSLNAKYLLKK